MCIPFFSQKVFFLFFLTFVLSVFHVMPNQNFRSWIEFITYSKKAHIIKEKNHFDLLKNNILYYNRLLERQFLCLLNCECSIPRNSWLTGSQTSLPLSGGFLKSFLPLLTIWQNRVLQICEYKHALLKSNAYKSKASHIWFHRLPRQFLPRDHGGSGHKN